MTPFTVSLFKLFLFSLLESIANVLLNVFNQMIEQVRNHPLITLAVVVIVVVCTFACTFS